jgi:hypothetical protein
MTDNLNREEKKHTVERNDLVGGIVTDASFERLRLTMVTISVPNGRKSNIVADDGVLICTRVI